MGDYWLLVLWAIVGGVAGWAAHRWLQPRIQRDIKLDVGIAIFGALTAGIVFNILDVPRVENFVIWSIIAALVGAGIMLSLMLIYIGFATQAEEINRRNS